MPQPNRSHQVQDYFVDRVRAIHAARRERVMSLRTRADAEAYRDEVKRKLRRCFGKPPQRTPLNPRVTRTIEDDDYTIDCLTYESRPGLIVTANLYRPHGDGPFPAVLGACGHSLHGKAEPLYQAFARHLALNGYVVLIYDPISQGERLQYVGVDGMPQDPPNCCFEHNMAGNQMSLVGDHFGMWRTWDGIRSLDVLLDQPGVDRSRVGMTGNSGGGTMTTYLNAMDDRFTMAAPSCFVTTYLHNLENELPADSEQIPPGVLGAGLEMADFYIAQAPRPTMLIGQTDCFFDERGVREAHEEMRHVYKLLGAEKDAQLFIGAHNHGYHPDGRAAMAAFFNKLLGKRKPKPEPDAKRAPEQLRATATGQVKDDADNRFVWSFTAETAREVAKQRGKPDAAALRRAATRVLNLPKRTGAPHYRILRPVEAGDDVAQYHTLAPIGIDTEPGIVATLAWWRSSIQGYRPHPPSDESLMLYLPHVSTRADLADGMPPDAPDPLWSLEVRGIGASQPETCGDTDFFSSYGADYFYASHGQMLGESYFGRRVHDALATLDLLKSRRVKRVHLVARGMGTVLASFAGLLHPLVTELTLHDALRSFHELTQAPYNAWPLSTLPRGVLRHFDLPDIHRMLRKEKKLKIASVWDAAMKPVSEPATAK